jgi:hypothetical protein
MSEPIVTDAEETAAGLNPSHEAFPPESPFALEFNCTNPDGMAVTGWFPATPTKTISLLFGFGLDNVPEGAVELPDAVVA